MMILNILKENRNSVLLIQENKNKKIVIGVPHHAPLGTPNLPCEEHRNADENAGNIGYNISKILKCPCIIACNYFIDPNKCTNTDYYKKIRSWNPRYLVEIHGHGGIKAKYDIEISCGKQERSVYAEKMANKLKEKLNDISELNNYSISGSFEKIYFKASKTATISADEWIPFHIELPKTIRSDEKIYNLFCKQLAEAINEITSEITVEEPN